MAVFRYQQTCYDLEGQWQEGSFVFHHASAAVPWQVHELEPGVYLVRQGPTVALVHALQERNRLWLSFQGQTYVLEAQKTVARHQLAHAVSNVLEAPLTGKVLQVQVIPGQTVEAGVTAVILESMKMETALTTPFAARVVAVHCKPGGSVSVGQILVQLEPLANAEA